MVTRTDTGGDQHYPALSEPELIRLAQKGDRRAYDQLVRIYQRQVYRWAFHVVRTHDLADEVAQDVFVRTYQAIDRVNPDRPFGAWLCRSTVNVALNIVRKQQFRTQWAQENRPDPSDFERESAQPDAGFRRKRVLQRLEAAINDLPPLYRTIMLLRIRDEMSYDEISKALGVSMGTVMSRIARARHRLREALGDLMDDLRE
jgi:RNA polymerase sigma-70 factor (ECF subfamily)